LSLYNWFIPLSRKSRKCVAPHKLGCEENSQ
jgi:hypothetical protein